MDMNFFPSADNEDDLIAQKQKEINPSIKKVIPNCNLWNLSSTGDPLKERVL